MKKELWAKVKMIFICIVIIFVLSYVIVTIYMFSNFNQHLFREEINETIINRFNHLFKHNLKDSKMIFKHSKGSGDIAFYSNELLEVIILELTQYQNLDIQRMEIKNKFLPTKKVDFITYGSIFSKEYPFFWISMYNKIIESSHIYIDVSPEITERGENYIYTRFSSNIFAISSTEKYPDLNFTMLEDDANYIFELLILKRDGKVYFIIGHPMESGKNIPEEESLLRLISLPGSLPR